MPTTKKLPRISAFAVFCLLGGLMFLGFRYPFVGRDEIILGEPRSLVGWSVLLVLIYSISRVYLTRNAAKRRSHLLFDDICHFIAGTLFILAMIPIINGALDYSSVRVHQTTVADKRTIAERYGGHYYLVVTDWRAPNNWVNLEVSREIYLGIDDSSGPQPGDPIQIETSKRFLGYERFRGVK